MILKAWQDLKKDSICINGMRCPFLLWKLTDCRKYIIEKGTQVETWGMILLSAKCVESFQDGKIFMLLSHHDCTTINAKSNLYRL